MTNSSHTPKWIWNLLIASAILPVAIFLTYFVIGGIRQYRYINSDEYRIVKLMYHTNLIRKYELFLTTYTNLLEKGSRQQGLSFNEAILHHRAELQVQINIEQLKYVISEIRNGKSEEEAWKSLELKLKRENPFR